MFQFDIRIEVETQGQRFTEVAKLIDAAVEAIKKIDPSVSVKVDSVYCYEQDEDEVKVKNEA